jgi:hypothetical protein
VEPEEVGVTWRSTRRARRDSRFFVSDDIWNVIDCVENGVKQEDEMSGRYKIKIRIRSTSDRVSTQTRQSCAGRGKGTEGLCVTGTVLNDLRCQEVGEAQQQRDVEGATRHPTFRTAQCVQTVLSLSPSVLPLFITTSLYWPFAATCFSGESGRIPGHPRLLPPHCPLVAVQPRRACRNSLRSAAGPVCCASHIRPTL